MTQLFTPMQRLLFSGLFISLLLTGCKGSTPGTSVESDSGPNRIPAGVLSQPDPVPKDEPLSASGNSLSYVVFGKRYHRLASARSFDQTGVASWYGRKFHGRLTASGEPYDMYSMTAAHKAIPLPTFARVTNLANNRSVIVRINDRGPFVGDRLIDLSYAAAAKLDMLDAGTAKVRVVTLSGVPGEGVPKTQVADAKPVPADQPYVKPYDEPRPVVQVPVGVTATTTLAPHTVSSTGRFLQIGAYGSFNSADRLRAQVDGSVAGDVFVSKLPTGALFRVRIGPFANDAEVAAARVMLRERHSIDAILVSPAEATRTCC